MTATPADVLAFWREAGPGKWFEKDTAFDAEIARRFRVTYDLAATGALDSWEETAEGAYALIVVLDQFPRNLFRNSPRAFATDPHAVAIAEKAIAAGFDMQIEVPERRFFYMPFMHAEDLDLQERCIALCEASDDPDGVKYAIIHRDIIRDFGRFPHRNPLFGRDTTAEEKAFLAEGGFAG